MSIVLRTNGNEPYYKTKINKKLANELEEAGFFKNYNEEFGYVEGEYENSKFFYKGNNYKLEYFSGCFHPFLLMLK